MCYLFQGLENTVPYPVAHLTTRPISNTVLTSKARMDGDASSGTIPYQSRSSEMQALCSVSKYISAVAIEHLYYEVNYATGDDVEIPLDIGIS